MNIALYGAGGHYWAMTERGPGALERSAKRLSIGSSQIAWRDGGLTIEIDEVTAPFPRRIRGMVHVRPILSGLQTHALDPAARHLWHPIAPLARVSVDLVRPRQQWSGSGYIDHNRGEEPLESGFSHWSWSRTVEPECTRIHYDVVRRDGTEGGLARAFSIGGEQNIVEVPPLAEIGRSRWRLPIRARTTNGGDRVVLQSWEDGPFYARSLINQRLPDGTVPAIHEALSLDRFDRRWVQVLLPFRMPRRR